jgi:cardiolipin synthase
MIFEYLLSLISVYLLVALGAGIHVLLYKRDSRSALGWLALIVLFPILGAVLYLLFGVNRVARKARRISLHVSPEGGKRRHVVSSSTAPSMSRVGFNIARSELTGGNSVTTYYNGENAYPPMLEAIDQARQEILLSSYIFDSDATGLQFIDRLTAARDRGVQVRILVDDVGIRYSFPTIIRVIKKRGLHFRRFMPLRLLPPSFSINLRTHRKLLIADRSVSFAGGMNIGDRQLVEGPSPHRASDLHFRIEGAIIEDFVNLFDEDWQYAGGMPLARRAVTASTAGTARCRLISDGPDENLDSLTLLIIGILSSARKRVWIMSPYFLPDQKMMGSLQAAALSGIDIQVMIPEKNNWPLVQWALQHNMADLLDTGVRIMRRPPPFAHSKMLLADDDYVMVGSSNMDPRSLRLNFELGIEVFEPSLNRELSDHFEKTASDCIPFTTEDLHSRGTLARLRDGAAAMFGPYL